LHLPFGLLPCLIFLPDFSAIAQEFEVPTNYKFENIEDYGFYRDDVMNAIHWYETTPLNEESEKRQLINQFLFQWLSGSPSISINILPYVMELSKENPDLLMVFMGGWARHQIQFEEHNNLKLNMLGINSIIKLYKLGGINKDKNLEKLIKIIEKGNLEQWVQERIS
jgi:hypothetical protein